MASTKIISPTGRIVVGLVGLTVSIILLAAFVGIFPDHREDLNRNRRQQYESLGRGLSGLIDSSDEVAIRQHFQSVVQGIGDIQTAGLRRANGEHFDEVGNHFDTSNSGSVTDSAAVSICIPIFSNEQLWGTLELQPAPIPPARSGLLANRPEFVLIAFVVIFGMITFYGYLSIALRHLNPTKVISRRVREALDSLGDGLLVLDSEERIVMANQAFQDSSGRKLEDLIGKQAKSLPFISREAMETGNQCQTPWQTTLDSGEQIRGKILGIETRGNQATTYSVSCTPILDEDGRKQGVLASFEDVNQLERKKNELKEMVIQLDASTAEIKRQNRELAILATRDALTGSMNRRSFFQKFDAEFAWAQKHHQPLSAFMIDIDHFKSINDSYGHATGDLVLQRVAATLESTVRDSDIVCRYGGEEFSILLPNTEIEQAVVVAEKIRRTLEELDFEQLSITACVGVSALSETPDSSHALLEQADKCLLMAKRNGRNQVIRFDQIPDTRGGESAEFRRTGAAEHHDSGIPFHAVTALISALAYRDQETANHCRRVADMCVAVAEGMLSMRECYMLEIAGLLHDIGKIGVPDAILLKPDALTDEEWNVMKMHERLGVELVRTTFACQEIDDIVANYRKPYYGYSESKLPIGSRILAIVDAYDSMTTDKTYRKGMNRDDAIAELRRCGGQQFDTELVELVIGTINVRGNELTSNQEQISKAAALNIGLQIESLSAAFDNRDIGGITAIASRLNDTALKHGAAQIAEKARLIAAVPQREDALFDVLQNTNELLDLCRSTQRTLLNPLISPSGEV